MNGNIADFRVTFAHMDEAALVTAIELGQLIGKSPNALYHVLCREPDALPKPVFRQNRYIRWRVSDVREWLQNLAAHAEGESGTSTARRRGRPRLLIGKAGQVAAPSMKGLE